MRERPRQRKTPEKIFLPPQDPRAVEEFKQSVADLRRFSPVPQEQAKPKKEKIKQQIGTRKMDSVHERKKHGQESQKKQMDLDL